MGADCEKILHGGGVDGSCTTRQTAGRASGAPRLPVDRRVCAGRRRGFPPSSTPSRPPGVRVSRARRALPRVRRDARARAGRLRSHAVSRRVPGERGRRVVDAGTVRDRGLAPGLPPHQERARGQRARGRDGPRSRDAARAREVVARRDGDDVGPDRRRPSRARHGARDGDARARRTLDGRAHRVVGEGRLRLHAGRRARARPARRCGRWSIR